MEPHELDKYIGNKLRESENARGEGAIDGMNRVWSSIEPQLKKRTSFQWMKMAAVIFLLLMPSVYLYLRNREQGRQIMTLKRKLTMIDKNYSLKLKNLASNQKEKVVVQHDTVKLIRTVEKKIIPETVETVKVVRDTVILYRQPETDRNRAESVPAIPSPDRLNPAWQEGPVKTEYILSKDATAKKKKKSRSFQISLGAGSGPSQSEPELAFKTKL